MTPSDIELGTVVSGTLDSGLEPPPPVVAPQQQSCCGQCCGRVVKDWTQVLGGVLVVGGLGAGVAGIAMEEYLVIVGGAVSILASSILLCARISCLKPKKELERQVVDLGDEVERLSSNEAVLKQRWQDLTKVLSEAEQSIGHLGSVLKVPVTKLENVTEQISAIEEKMRVLVDLYHRYKAATEAFSHDLKVFRESKRVTKASISQLGKGVKSLELAEDELSEEVDEYQDAAEFHRQQNADLRKMLSSFKTDFVAMQRRFVAMQEVLAELRKHVVKIDEADDKFRDGGEGFQQGVDRAHETVIPRLQQMLDKLEREVGLLAQDSEHSLGVDDSDSGEMISVVVHSSTDDDVRHASSSSGGKETI